MDAGQQRAERRHAEASQQASVRRSALARQGAAVVLLERLPWQGVGLGAGAGLALGTKDGGWEKDGGGRSARRQSREALSSCRPLRSNGFSASFSARICGLSKGGIRMGCCRDLAQAQAPFIAARIQPAVAPDVIHRS